MERSIAIEGSETISAMLEGSFRESEDNVIRFPDIHGPILEKVIMYLYYRERYKNSTGKIPVFDIEPEFALDLMEASNYLDC